MARFSPRFRGLKPTEVTWRSGTAWGSDKLELSEVAWSGPGWALRLTRVASPSTIVGHWFEDLRIAGVRVIADHRGIGFDSLTAARDHAASAFQSVRRALAKERVS